MEKFNISKEAMQQLESLKATLNCEGAAVAYGTPTACTTCWGGTCCTNPITG